MFHKNSNSHLELNEVFGAKGKIALVTGGGFGIGLVATQALAVNGAKVYIVGRTIEKLDAIIPLVGDVTQKDGVKKLVNEIESREKCGKDAAELKKNLFDTTTVDEWTSVLSINVVAPFLIATAFLPLLQRQFSYHSSKGAFVHLNKMLATEITRAGLSVRVNGIAPGVFPSEMTAGEDQKSSIPKEQQQKLTPGSVRSGDDRDMAATILFAASCQYLNGENIPVDGGFLVHVGQ
ncbi:hypothetical protein B0H19DRAFT_1209954 [Mycena capillaripes]|nr:hypothetical protein B0H19DRAFT_1209954 [Mycena capillaripes]